MGQRQEPDTVACQELLDLAIGSHGAEAKANSVTYEEVFGPDW